MDRSSHSRYTLTIAAAALAGVFAACSGQSEKASVAGSAGGSPTPRSEYTCDEDNGSITLPSGFCATVFADNIGHARHIAVAPGGDVYVNTRVHKDKAGNIPANPAGGYTVALRDADGDGHADKRERFGAIYQPGREGGGSGIAVYGDALYVEVDDKIVRYPLSGGALAPTAEPQIVLSGLPMSGGHTVHTFAIAPDGTMYVNSGSATNNCQLQDRTLESMGQKPCAELSERAGIWKYDAKKTGQVFSPAERFATSLRNTVALATRADGALYAAINGRDQLSDNWPKLFTETQGNDLPAEVMAKVDAGDDFGWPYCLYDGAAKAYVLAPEYGGDGKATGDCANRKPPAVVFPAHWAPLAIAFYTSPTFPAKYRDGAFVTFHGSWNRTPTQQGYLVAFVPFRDGKPAGTFEEFATDFGGAALPADPKLAQHRPVGVAVGPDGTLYVTDDVKGRIWRITHVK
jgi:glucose/arabinose dehydrogenase